MINDAFLLICFSDPSLNRMVEVVKGAVNLCSGVYISVGFFGYVTFSETVEGNILTAFAPSLMVESIKMGFVLSVAVSFPIVMFPIRTSLHSLVFRKQYQGLNTSGAESGQGTIFGHICFATTSKF